MKKALHWICLSGMIICLAFPAMSFSASLGGEPANTWEVIGQAPYAEDMSEFLSHKGLSLSEVGRRSVTADGTVVLTVPLIGDQDRLVCSPNVSLEYQNSAFDIAEFNERFSPEKLEAAQRYLFNIRSQGFDIPIFLQSLKYSGQDHGIVTLSDMNGNKIVIDPLSGLIFGEDALPSSYSSARNLSWSTMWDCIKQALGLPTGQSFWSILDNFCTYTGNIQTVLSLCISCTDCWTIIGCVDCIAGWVIFIGCDIAVNVAHCYEGGDDDDDDTELSNNQSVSFSVTQGQKKYYKFNVPSGSSTLQVRMTNVSGDPDLYTRSGSRPTTSTYACRPYYGSGSSETCIHNSPSPGYWYMMIRGYSTGSGSLTASYSGGGDDDDDDCSCSNVLSNGQSVSVSVSQGQKKYYCINVPSSASSVTVRITNVSGDPDLYTRNGSVPTTSIYSCRPYYASGSSETCTNSQTGCWHIMVRGYSSGSCTLTATYN